MFAKTVCQLAFSVPLCFKVKELIRLRCQDLKHRGTEFTEKKRSWMPKINRCFTFNPLYRNCKPSCTRRV